MYLKNLIMENVGPVDRIDIEMSFGENGNPKPLFLVGPNGSGKSIVLASIVDALHEIATRFFDDVLPGQGMGYSYFKPVQPSGQRIGKGYGFCFLRITSEETDIQYIEKTGTLSFADCQLKTNDLLSLSGQWEVLGNHKELTFLSKKEHKSIERDIMNNSYCFFPSQRYEKPHWLNSEANVGEGFRFVQNFSDKLGKNIMCETSLEENKSWILDVFLDSRSDIEGDFVNNRYQFSDLSQGRQSALILQSRKNLEKILTEILERQVQLAVGVRSYAGYRLSVSRKGYPRDLIIPSLDNLSLGQSTLFNLFATVIRHSDLADLTKSIFLDKMEGIVIIDEIDAHLHHNLQVGVLPRLIKLFPKIQFIVTTHSPLVLLGMEREFGKDGFVIKELPSGNNLIVEDFSEFRDAYNTIAETEAYKRMVQEVAINNGGKLSIFSEGGNGEHIEKALEILAPKLLDKVYIEKRASIKKGKDDLKKVFRAVSPSENMGKALFVWDCDCASEIQGLSETENFMTFCFNENQENKKARDGDGKAIGIENLYSDDLFTGEVYKVKKTSIHYGGEKQETLFSKDSFLIKIKEQSDPAVFEKFQPLVCKIKSILEEDTDKKKEV